MKFITTPINCNCVSSLIYHVLCSLPDLIQKHQRLYFQSQCQYFKDGFYFVQEKALKALNVTLNQKQ